MELSYFFVLFCLRMINGVSSQSEYRPRSLTVAIPSTYRFLLSGAKPIRATVRVQADQFPSRITGTNIWKMSAWLSQDPEDTNINGFEEQVLSSGQRRKAAVANRQLALKTEYGPPAGLAGCSELQYFCVRLSAADDVRLNDGTNLTVRGDPGVLTSCAEVPSCHDNRPRCNYNGQTYPVGASWDGNNCTVCECQTNQRPRCQPRICNKTICDNPVKDKGSCCARCPNSCRDDESMYNSGDTWQPDVCSSCDCVDGLINCTETQCRRPTCESNVVVHAASVCCPRCPAECDYGGTLHVHGSTWDEDSCTHCQCSDGIASCVTERCMELDCEVHKNLPQQCCLVCARDKCVVDDATHSNGDSWASGLCMTCRCLEGEVSCLKRHCDCLLTNNEVKRHRESWDLNCTTCSCYNGHVVCAPRETTANECSDCIFRTQLVPYGETYQIYDEGSCFNCECGGKCQKTTSSCQDQWRVSAVKPSKVKLKIPKNAAVNGGSNTKKFKFAVVVQFDDGQDTTRYVNGTNLWQIKAWFGKKEDGSGKRNAKIKQVASPSQASAAYVRGQKLTFEGNSKFKTKSLACKSLQYFCVKFKVSYDATTIDEARLILIQNSDTGLLTDCVRVPKCKDKKGKRKNSKQPE